MWSCRLQWQVNFMIVLTFLGFFYSFFLKLIVTCRLCVIYVREGNNSLTHWLTHWLTHSLTDSCKHSFTRGLRRNDLCCHSGTAWVGPAIARLRRSALWVQCCCGSINHSNADCMCGQFLFYHKNEAIHCDKFSDDETSCWNVPG